jgi:hypothetical protein
MNLIRSKIAAVLYALADRIAPLDGGPKRPLSKAASANLDGGPKRP